MRAGKLKMKRYPVRKQGGGWALALLFGFLLGAAAAAFGKQAWQSVLPDSLVFREPLPAKTQEPAPREERTLTLPGHTWYALQLGAFDSADAAENLAASYRSRGAAGYVRVQDRYQVLAAAYGTRADAQKVITQLRAGHQIEAVLTEISQPEITLRLTGRRDQLTALSDAYDFLEQLPIQLGTLSDSLDRGKADRQTALDALKSHQDTLGALKKRIGALFDENVPPAVRDTADMLDALSLSLDKALAAQGAAAFGGQIKYAQLQCLCRMAEHAAGLSGQ